MVHRAVCGVVACQVCVRLSQTSVCCTILIGRCLCKNKTKKRLSTAVPCPGVTFSNMEAIHRSAVPRCYVFQYLEAIHRSAVPGEWLRERVYA